ncbi:transcriptional regulator with XRE-family HTH domain [Methanococcus voltae]|uniref:Transcriptional regulator with XRE-family HTH domain n=1 Tax=Methanococcus voltae TaxID=2188 RepID=A0A8J7S0R2_METVO|nr:cupin domain-containing protein [Methanococcus voltae]MBP2201275.1 transcriptional regulator with XRE-family HTH domain [Methanococcus voltae]
MKSNIRDIILRIIEFREITGISIDEMAEYLHITSEQYRAYENGDADIPASMLCEIAHKFNVDLSLLLTGKDTKMHIFSVTRKNQGVIVNRRKEYKYENLAFNLTHKKAEPFIVTVDPREDGTRPSDNSHLGQEFIYVLEGVLKVYINNNEIILNEGDSMFFDSTYEHAMEALEGKKAKFLDLLV